MIAIEPTKPRRIELILRQIESLPTLPAVATRLLELTLSDDSHARQVSELISADPALTAKVLSLCRSAEKGVRNEVLTIDKAVVLMGFDAIRNAVLSVKVCEMFAEADTPDTSKTAKAQAEKKSHLFDRRAFWMHSLAVGVMAERLAQSHPGRRDLHGDEAFVCGLLHDVGKLALDEVLPQSYDRIIELTDFNQGNIAQFERRIIGIDHHTAGKRLAEQWQLPHRLQDCIWLHGSTFDLLPKLKHRNLVALISLADQLCRRQHLGYSGNYPFVQSAEDLIKHLKLNADSVERVTESLYEKVQERASVLGLSESPTRAMYLRSIQQANEELGRINHTLERRGRTVQQQSAMLDAVSTFHRGAVPGQTAQDVMDSVVESARDCLGGGFYAMLVTGNVLDDHGSNWLICQYNREAQPVDAQYLEPPEQVTHLSDLDPPHASGSVAVRAMAVAPWLSDYLVGVADPQQVKLLTLGCGWGTSAILLHDRETLPNSQVLAPLTATWGSAIASAQQHEGARHLAEQIAESNGALADAQEKLLRQDALARLGEMAAGAAHEMNNPLAVISGRSQLLTLSLKNSSQEHKAAQTIFRESHRLSDLISALRMFAEPPVAQRQTVDIGKLLDEVVQRVTRQYLNDKDNLLVNLHIKQGLDEVLIDPQMVERAATELLTNAVLAKPKHSIQVKALTPPGDPALLIQITDDGVGMNEYTLDHAMDPFFSSHPAGRRVGMGLSRAQQLAAAHGGDITLRSTHGNGTVSSMLLPLTG